MMKTDRTERHRNSDVWDGQLTRHVVNDGFDALIEREWLVTNGLGGYASGTIAGAATRRYHGLLIAAHPAPLGRLVLLSHLGEQYLTPKAIHSIGFIERLNQSMPIDDLQVLDGFRLEWGLPVWQYSIDGHVIEKRLSMPHGQNTVMVNYRLIEGQGPVELRLRPAVHFRGHDDPVSTPTLGEYVMTTSGGRYELVNHSLDFPPLRLQLEGHASGFALDETELPDVLYRIEASRGYDNVGRMWSPGYFEARLTQDEDVSLIASTESWDRLQALSVHEALSIEVERRRRLIETADPAARRGVPAELVLAADQFIIAPASRVEDSARAEAAGEQARTIIAGYHWFTDWGRDSMISLEGLTLVTGRYAEAGYILRTFLGHVRDGLIPNFFPDRGTEGVYHTADATLWYFHALSRYMAVTGDRTVLRGYLPVLNEIISHHRNGTRFGIRMDPQDGLLIQGAEGYQLTWMDAKVDGWVVTPRRGKAVEINALWYNALRLLQQWRQESGEDEREITTIADRVQASFNARFWCDSEQGLYDVIDGERGNDSACRPNQIFSISLPNPVLDPSRWEIVLRTVQERLLTPYGLRSLAPGHPDYKPQYYGDLRSRDAAYHQGTVWAWLIGPFVDAWRRVYPHRVHECSELLTGFDSHLSEACIGTISEVFDAEAPYLPRGCAAQAWSVAEVLRVSTLISSSQERD
ncbi:amylo-alpha-1,6-glucosidase [Schlesneria paludicola]|uniref:amylo-alpha-1,6-glucosidase n=1 Tax=Schlesneria paludicola TaxID=360056 RepID=UPI00029A86E7|nr:amylo-alpha-1,6-glucosidase [Schlesneria paludicola]